MRALLCRLASLASVLAFASACGGGALREPPDVARAAFSRDHYCPLGRVETRALISMAQPPHAIAHDPERLAMWSRAALANTGAREPLGEDGATPRVVMAKGCGEDAKYDCFVEGGLTPVRRGRKYVQYTTVCVERAGGQP